MSVKQGSYEYDCDFYLRFRPVTNLFGVISAEVFVRQEWGILFIFIAGNQLCDI